MSLTCGIPFTTTIPADTANDSASDVRAVPSGTITFMVWFAVSIVVVDPGILPKGKELMERIISLPKTFLYT